MNMHAMPQQQMGGVGNITGPVGPPNPMMQQGVSPLMQSSPQQPPVGQQMVPQQQLAGKCLKTHKVNNNNNISSSSSSQRKLTIYLKLKVYLCR
ncbi:hypothetical protein EVAR_101557_1 [Eumeta japonica]|uniref:Uncharacterized protein n=1 Tax=Eumeta variegata TaxID=151549 RepID=A0A4C1TJG2_EUMVA|nr:hypothetical protein EVAR_101557_1 [Eumeta japonica]